MYDSAHPVQDKINNKSLTINFHSIVSHKMLFVCVHAYVHSYILHTYVCESGGKKLSFCGKSGVLCFFVTPVLRFVLLPNYQRVQILINFPIMYSLTIFGKKISLTVIDDVIQYLGNGALTIKWWFFKVTCLNFQFSQ